MTAIRQAIGDYLAVRRALGCKLEDHGWLLADFASFLEAAGAGTVTTSLALDWATLPEDCLPSWHAARLRVVRGFARHLQALDPATEVPPAGLLPGSNRRAVPYLYSGAEIRALMAATASLRPALHAATIKTLIGLLAVTGMRLNEVIRLDRADLDTADGILVIRDSKFAKSRQIPLHPGTLAALARYGQLRDRHVPCPGTPALLVSTAGTRLISQGVHYVFARLVRQAGLAPRSPDCRPRLHDFRHSLAVTTLLGWYRDGLDVQALLPVLSTSPGAQQARQHLLVPVGRPRTAGPGRRTPPDRAGGAAVSALAPTLQAFFTSRPTSQRHASPNTVAADRDAWRLLLRYAQDRTSKQPCQLDLADLDAPFVAGFLDHLEHDRGNSVRTRNARLAAIRSFFRYAALCHPEHAGLIARVLAIPAKKAHRTELCYLNQPETDALLAAPGRDTWTGRRDHALLDVAAGTGLRVSELTGLRNRDIQLGTGAHLSCEGKGRKHRSTPLRKQTAAVLAAWMNERGGGPGDPLFPTRRGTPISRGAVGRPVAKHAAAAARRCPSLRGKKITPHVLRHWCAMSLLAQGVDTAVTALWLGHERVETTQIYVHADMTIKERALARTAPPNTTPGRYQPPGSLLAFLTSL